MTIRALPRRTTTLRAPEARGVPARRNRLTTRHDTPPAPDVFYPLAGFVRLVKPLCCVGPVGHVRAVRFVGLVALVGLVGLAHAEPGGADSAGADSGGVDSSLAGSARAGSDRARETSFFGINGSKIFHIPDQPDIYRPRFEWMKELGVRWDRIDLWWHAVEPEPGRFDFSRPDKAFDEFEAHGVQWYPILCYGAAGWEGRNAPQTDEEFERFANYAFQVVSRYKTRAKIWSLWNEPNIPNFWSPQPNAEHYARLMKVTREAVRRADPEAKICAPSLAPLGAWDRKFTERLYQLGCAEHFDIFDYHYYRNNAPEDEVARELAEIRAVMARYGDAAKPIWISESGVNSPISRKPRSYERQAAFVVRNHLLCLALGVERFFYFDLQNWHDKPDGEWDATLGLVEAGGLKKPSFHAYRTMVAEVDHKEVFGRCVSLGDGVEGVLIRDAKTGEATLAVWATGEKRTLQVRCEPRDVAVVQPDGAAEIDKMDGAASGESASSEKSSAAAPESRIIEVAIDARPRFVRPVDLAAYLPDAGLRLDPALVILAPGEQTRLTLHRHPLLDSAAVRITGLTLPKGIDWHPDEARLVCVDTLPPGRLDIAADIEVEFGPEDRRETTKLKRTAQVEIVPTLSLSLRPYLEDGALRFQATLANQTKRTMEEPLQVVERREGGEPRVLVDPGEQALAANETRPLMMRDE